MYLKTIKMLPNLVMVKTMADAHKLYRQLEGNLVMVVETEEVYAASPLFFKREKVGGKMKNIAYGYFIQIYGAARFWEEIAIQGQELEAKINAALEKKGPGELVRIEQKEAITFEDEEQQADEIKLHFNGEGGVQ